jgi:potassium/chloride transporter 4/5/6
MKRSKMKSSTSYSPCFIIKQYFSLFSMCVLGKRLLKDISMNDCNKEPFGPLHQIFCGNSSSGNEGSCDPYFEAHNVSKVRGIKGLSSGVFLGKLYTNKYQYYGQVVNP